MICVIEDDLLWLSQQKCVVARLVGIEYHQIPPMPHKGQTEKNSLRANVFRVTPESGHCSMQSACLKSARADSVRIDYRPAVRPWEASLEMITRVAMRYSANSVPRVQFLFASEPCKPLKPR